MGNKQSQGYQSHGINIQDKLEWERVEVNGSTFYHNVFSNQFYRICTITHQQPHLSWVISRTKYTFPNTPHIILIHPNHFHCLIEDTPYPLNKVIEECKETLLMVLFSILEIVKVVRMLLKKYGCFEIHHKHIKGTLSGKLVVWIHSNFIQCQRQYPLVNSQDSERKMTQQLYWIFQPYIYNHARQIKLSNFLQFQHSLDDLIKDHLHRNNYNSSSLLHTNQEHDESTLNYYHHHKISNHPIDHKFNTLSSDSCHSPHSQTSSRLVNGLVYSFNNHPQIPKSHTNKIKFTYESPINIKLPQQKQLRSYASWRTLPKQSNLYPTKVQLDMVMPQSTNQQISLQSRTIMNRSNSFSTFGTIPQSKPQQQSRRTYLIKSKIIEEKMKQSHSDINIQNSLSREVHNLFLDEQDNNDFNQIMLNELANQLNDVLS